MTRIKSGYEISLINGKIPPRNGVDVRPGDRMGLDTDAVIEYIKRQKKAKGFNQAMSVGDNNPIAIELPGNARVMLGFALNFTDFVGGATRPTGTCELMVNNEVMIEAVGVEFFGKEFTDQEYYFLPRPVSGSDGIKMTIKGVGATYTMLVNFYYL